MISFNKTLLLIILLGLALRLYKVSTPLADWHSFRQADTASVTREYVKHGIDLLHPRYHDLSNIQSGARVNGNDNVEGWRMVEFPIVNGFLALILRSFTFLDLVVVSRIASILASLVTLVFLSLLIKDVYSKKVALVSAFFFATLPYSVYYSRVILPEPFFIALSVLSAWLYLQSILKHKISYAFFSAMVFSVALLIKPMAIFFLPLFIGIRFRDSLKITKKDIATAVFFILSTVPLYFWRSWITQYPAGIPLSDWLYNGGGPGNKLSPLYKIRFRPAWWRWIFYERLTKLFLGFFGQIFFLSGVASLIKSLNNRERSRGIIFLSWGIGSLLYVIVFAAGNVQHDYYQTLLVPFVCAMLGIGTITLYRIIALRFTVRWALFFVGVIVVGLYSLAWQQVRGYYNINNWAIVHAGQEADRILPVDAKVIAPYQGDTAFLFQVNRTGWPIGFDIEKKMSEGAQYYISVNYDDEARELEKKFDTVKKTDEFIILDLQKKNKE